MRLVSTALRVAVWVGWIVVAVLVIVVIPFTLDRQTVAPAAALVRFAFSQGTLVKPPPGFAQERAGVSVTRDVAIPVPGAPAAMIDVYTPKATPGKAAVRRPVVLWLHGGGFLSGDRAQVADYAAMLAAQGFVVANLEYSLAPAYEYPVPVLQGTAALVYLSAHAGRFGGDPTRMAVGGDSAGAQIASELAAVQTNPSLAAAVDLTPSVHLRAAVLFCGLYDMRTVGDTGFPALRTFLWSYTGYRTWTDYPQIDELSTTDQVTKDYPPTFLTVGGGDPFRNQAYELDAALEHQGVDVSHRFWAGPALGHEYQFDFRTAAAQEVFRETVTFLKQRTSAEPAGKRAS